MLLNSFTWTCALKRIIKVPRWPKYIGRNDASKPYADHPSQPPDCRPGTRSTLSLNSRLRCSLAGIPAGRCSLQDCRSLAQVTSFEFGLKCCVSGLKVVDFSPKSGAGIIPKSVGLFQACVEVFQSLLDLLPLFGALCETTALLCHMVSIVCSEITREVIRQGIFLPKYVLSTRTTKKDIRAMPLNSVAPIFVSSPGG